MKPSLQMTKPSGTGGIMMQQQSSNGIPRYHTSNIRPPGTTDLNYGMSKLLCFYD